VKILLTGATGFIGQHLVNNLVSKGYKVICLVRNVALAQKKLLNHPNINYVKADITELKSLEKAPFAVDCVVHLAALTNPPKGIKNTWPLFKKINIIGTENLLSHLKETGQFIFISSVDSQGSLKDLNQVDETYVGKPDSAYDKSKKIAEKRVIEICQKKGFSYTILRPTMVYGPGRSNPKMMKINNMIFLFGKVVKMGLFPLLGNGDNMLPLVHIDNVVQGIKRSIDNKRALGEIFILNDKENFSFAQIIDFISQILNKKCFKVKIPLPLLNFVFSLPIPLPLSKKGLEYLTTSRSYSIQKAQKLLEYKPFGTKQGLEKTFKWYLDEKWL